MGTRAERVKLEPVIKLLKTRGHEVEVIDIMQRESRAREIWRKLYPDSSKTGFFLASIIAGAWIVKKAITLNLKGDKVLIYGNTMSAMVGAIAAKVRFKKLMMLESGVRFKVLAYDFPRAFNELLADKRIEGSTILETMPKLERPKHRHGIVTIMKHDTDMPREEYLKKLNNAALVYTNSAGTVEECRALSVHVRPLWFKEFPVLKHVSSHEIVEAIENWR